MPHTPTTPLEVARFLSEFPQKTAYFTYGASTYADAGPKNAKLTLLLLHGNPTWSFLYRHLLRDLQKDYRVIAPDLLGYGMSAKPADPAAYEVQNQADAIINILKQAKVGNFVVMGQDWGGPLAALVAEAFTSQCKGLILMNTYLPGMTIFSSGVRLFMKTHIGQFAAVQLDLFRLFAFRLGFYRPVSRQIRKAYYYPQQTAKERLGIGLFPAQIPGARQSANGQALMQKIDTFLQTSALPKLLLFSDHDVVFKPRVVNAAKDHVKNASYCAITNAGHYLQEDAPDRLIAAIRPWLKKL